MMKAITAHLNLVVFLLGCFFTGGCTNAPLQGGADSSLNRNSSISRRTKQQNEAPKHDKRQDTNAIAIPQYAGTLTGHWISQVLSNGKYLVLEDNSLWEIDSIDTIDTALWLPISNVVIVEKAYQGFVFYDIINTDDSEKASATFLGTVRLQTQIDGDFEGWDGDTVFVLSNGNILKQASYAYTYHYAYRPRVLVYLRGTYYYLLVDGVEESIMVYVIK